MPTPTLASQLYSFINTVSAMALGSSAVSAVNTEDFVSLGETVLSNAESTSRRSAFSAPAETIRPESKSTSVFSA